MRAIGGFLALAAIGGILYMGVSIANSKDKKRGGSEIEAGLFILKPGYKYKITGTFIGPNEGDLNKFYESLKEGEFTTPVVTQRDKDKYQYTTTFVMDDEQDVSLMLPGVVKLWGVPLNIERMEQLDEQKAAS